MASSGHSFSAAAPSLDIAAVQTPARLILCARRTTSAPSPVKKVIRMEEALNERIRGEERSRSRDLPAPGGRYPGEREEAALASVGKEVAVQVGEGWLRGRVDRVWASLGGKGAEVFLVDRGTSRRVAKNVGRFVRPLVREESVDVVRPLAHKFVLFGENKVPLNPKFY